MTEVTKQEILIYVMVATASVDLRLAERELLRIGALADVLPIFENVSRDDLQNYSRDCQQLLTTEDGLDRIVDLAASTLPASLYETAYALALDISAADLAVPIEEAEFLQLLRKALGIDNLIAAALETSAKVRARTFIE